MADLTVIRHHGSSIKDTRPDDDGTGKTHLSVGIDTDEISLVVKVYADGVLSIGTILDKFSYTAPVICRRGLLDGIVSTCCKSSCLDDIAGITVGCRYLPLPAIQLCRCSCRQIRCRVQLAISELIVKRL